MPGPSPDFLNMRCGDLVVISEFPAIDKNTDWWMGEIIHIANSARGIEPSIFQISCIDTGAVRTVNADSVIGLIKKTNRIINI